MSAASRFRVVLDTNVIVRMTLTEGGVAERLRVGVQARTFIVLWSDALIAEYKATLLSPSLTARYEWLTEREVALTLERLRYRGERVSPVRASFELPRDPDDEKLLELAIEGRASHLVTTDRDLLSLPGSRGDAGKRFRQRLRHLRVVDPLAFLHDLAGREE